LDLKQQTAGVAETADLVLHLTALTLEVVELEEVGLELAVVTEATAVETATKAPAQRPVRPILEEGEEEEVLTAVVALVVQVF
jgi:hypothetical protein